MSDKPTKAQLEVMARITRGRTCREWFHQNTIDAMRRRGWIEEGRDTERSYRTIITLTKDGRTALRNNADRYSQNCIERILEFTIEEAMLCRSIHRQFSPRLTAVREREVKRVRGLIEREMEYLSRLYLFVDGKEQAT